MKKIKVLSIFGTRPEAIKMAPIINEMYNFPHFIQQEICVTAQHRQMLDQVLQIFNISPSYDLNIMTQNQSLTQITSSALQGLEKIINSSKPDIVLVHGDTTTTFVSSLASFYSKVKIAHIEAGLRTFNKFEPFPEEINRKLTAVMTDLHFAPTTLSKQNLINENVDPNSIFVTGNTSVDCIKTTVKDNYVFNCSKLNHIDFQNNKVITLTAHRRENLGTPLENICNAILKIVQNNHNVQVVYAVHFNPAVRQVVYSILDNNPNIHLVDPLDIQDMHNLINKSYLVMTDSGGLQEEVPSLKKPVLVLRNVTERPEGIKSGSLKLAGTDTQNIFNLTQELLHNQQLYNLMANSKNPFGDGFASERIVKGILFHFGLIDTKPQEFIP